MKVLILAAGYGTRLYPLVKDTPKALLEIKGRPIVDHILDRIAVLDGLTEVVLVTNDKFYAILDRWAKNKEFVVPVKIVNDGTKSNDDRLGSIGDINFVLQQGLVDDDLLVVGGDNLFDFDLVAYSRWARERSPAVSIGLYDIGKIEEATKFGVVDIGQNGIIKSFEEKPQKPKSTLVAMCFYYLPKSSLGLVASYLAQTKKADRAGDYIKWLHENSDVYGFKFSGKWYDIGSVESYQDAQIHFVSKL